MCLVITVNEYEHLKEFHYISQHTTAAMEVSIRNFRAAHILAPIARLQQQGIANIPF